MVSFRLRGGVTGKSEIPGKKNSKPVQKQEGLFNTNPPGSILSQVPCHWDQQPSWFENSKSSMQNSKRSRDDVEGSENTLIWEPFAKRAS